MNIHHSSFLYNIKLHSSSKKLLRKNSQQVKLLNKHQIFSLHLWSGSYIKEFLSTFIIDSSLDRLESITLHFIKDKTLLSLLKKFTCLPRLFSLHIEARETLIDLSDGYRSIFALPVLKFIKVTLDDWLTLRSLPIATTKQQSTTIQSLIIDHCCTFKQLAILLSYTPELTHLEFCHEPVRDSDIETILPVTLSNLTHVSMDLNHLDYGEFEIFMKKFSSKLKVFHLIVRNDVPIYLASPIWEKLIQQDMPQLEKFSLKFYELADDEDRLADYIWPDNQFTSSFWIDRKWIFHVEIDTFDIIYLIHPYKYV